MQRFWYALQARRLSPSMSLALTGLLTLHLAASATLAAYGCHRLMLSCHYLRLRSTKRRRPNREPGGISPPVTVQIPLYNERYVADRVLSAAAALDYPRSLLEIQVLDDSTDSTTAEVERVVRRCRSRGIRMTHIRRASREGFKAGALAHGLQTAFGTLVAVFDADFVPPPDFLRRVVGEFEDPRVGMVQARWGHLNRTASMLTEIQALQLDAHFTIEHGVRYARGCFFNFNGTAGIWRREAIDSAGGWRADTLTEDLDLSYRAQLAGWRFVYRDDVVAPAELPVEIAAYRQQQQRWAQGGVQTAIALAPRLLRASLPPAVKWEAFWHLAGHMAYPVLVLLAVAGIAAGWVGGREFRPWLYGIDGVMLSFATLSLTLFYGLAAKRRGAHWVGRLALIPGVMILGAGISLGQSIAVGRALMRRRTPFLRTPKYRNCGDGNRRWRMASYRVGGLGMALLECCAGLGVLLVGLNAVIRHLAIPPGPVLLFGTGFLLTGGIAILQQRRPGASSEEHRIPVNRQPKPICRCATHLLTRAK